MIYKSCTVYCLLMRVTIGVIRIINSDHMQGRHHSCYLVHLVIRADLVCLVHHVDLVLQSHHVVLSVLLVLSVQVSPPLLEVLLVLVGLAVRVLHYCRAIQARLVFPESRWDLTRNFCSAISFSMFMIV